MNQLGVRIIRLAKGRDGTHVQLRLRNINGAAIELQSVRIRYAITNVFSGGMR
jgi:hypothetical protein